MFTNEQVSGSNSDISGLSMDCNTFKGFTYVTDSYESELMIMSKPYENDDLENNT